MQQNIIIIKLEVSMYNKINLFKNLSEDDILEILKFIKARKITFKKNMTIMSNISNTAEIGIILNGSASLVGIDYNGNRTMVLNLKPGDIFGGKFSCYLNEELSVVANKECLILFTEYNMLIKENNNKWSKIFNTNLIETLIEKINDYNFRIEILTKKTIREKLLEYFHQLENKSITKEFTLPFTFTSLAEYLSVDRSAMMREIKNMKEDQIIVIKEKNIKFIYR